MNNKKQLNWLVLSDSMNKTVVVSVARRFPHPAYKKYVNASKKYCIIFSKYVDYRSITKL